MMSDDSTISFRKVKDSNHILTEKIYQKKSNVSVTSSLFRNARSTTNSDTEPDTPGPTAQEIEAKSGSMLVLLFAFLVGVVALASVYLSFPALTPEEKPHLKLPREIDDAKRLGKVLLSYTDRYYTQVVVGYLVTFIFLQSFAIPGSIFLSIMAGYLFPFPLALFLVCLSSAVGASICYLLSDIVGRKIVYRYMRSRVRKWSRSVDHHREHMIYYMVFLRITPILPNWFINIVAPIINVPLMPFFVGTFIGVAPPSFIAIQTGTTLQTLTANSASVSMTSIGVLCAMAAVSMLPVVFKRFLRQHLE